LLVSARRGITAAIVLLIVACATADQRFRQHTYAAPGPGLERVAVIPLYAHRSYEESSRLGGVSPEIATERITRQLTDALLEAGVEIVPVDEVEHAFSAVERSTAVIDASIFADAASSTLGATSVLVGEVLRYRDARGATTATRHPASVAFHVTLYSAPEGHKLWAARYDYTQPPPVESTGSELHEAAMQKKWQTANEIAKRGADDVAAALAAER
jgi:hypothetical protein